MHINAAIRMKKDILIWFKYDFDDVEFKKLIQNIIQKMSENLYIIFKYKTKQLFYLVT